MWSHLQSQGTLQAFRIVLWFHPLAPERVTGFPAVGCGVQRRNSAERDPVGDSQRPVHHLDGSPGPDPGLYVLNHRLHVLQGRLSRRHR